MKSFFEEYPFESRKEESYRILYKYPNRVPVICEKYGNNNNIPDIDKKKFLAPRDLTLGQFIFVVRKRIKLTPEKAIFLFINNKLLPNTDLIGSLYDEYKTECGYLHIQYSGENTFG